MSDISLIITLTKILGERIGEGSLAYIHHGSDRASKNLMFSAVIDDAHTPIGYVSVLYTALLYHW